MSADLRNEIHSIKSQVESLTKGNWLQRNLGVVVMILVNVIAGVIFVVTIGAQSQVNSDNIVSNRKAITLKVSKALLDLELSNRDQKIESLEEKSSKNQKQNEHLFEKLETKIDKGNELLRQILRQMPRESK